MTDEEFERKIEGLSDFSKAMWRAGRFGFSLGRYAASPLYSLKDESGKEYEQRPEVSSEQVEATLKELGKTKNVDDLMKLFQRPTPLKRGRRLLIRSIRSVSYRFFPQGIALRQISLQKFYSKLAF